MHFFQNSPQDKSKVKKINKTQMQKHTDLERQTHLFWSNPTKDQKPHKDPDAKKQSRGLEA